MALFDLRYGALRDARRWRLIPPAGLGSSGPPALMLFNGFVYFVYLLS